MTWKNVKNELPKNTYECVVKMWNKFNDTWVTGIGVYDVQTNKWEVVDVSGFSYPVTLWFKTPKLK